MFAVIGVLWTLRWVFDLFFSSTLFQTLAMNMYAQPIKEPEECLASHVIDELTNRMEILEVAFKEQVFARETITREITDQSDIYESMDKKFAQFIEHLENVTSMYTELESKYKQLSSRVYSDG